MQVAFASLVGVEPMPFPTLVREAAARGLYAIEVNVGPGYRPIDDASHPGHLDLEAIVRDGPGRVQSILDAHDVIIVSLAPMLNVLAADPTVRAQRIAALRLTIDAAVVLGVDTVVTYAGSAFGMFFYGYPAVAPNHPSNHVAENLALFEEVYTPLAAYAEERGVRIAFETAARGGGEGNLAHCPELWDALFEAVPSPALGLSFDPSHLIWLHIPHIPDLVRRYGPRIHHVDGKDCEIMPERLARQGILGNNWWRYRLPGLGMVPWADVLSALKDVGYDGPVSIENEDPLFLGLDGVKWSANYLRNIFPM